MSHTITPPTEFEGQGLSLFLAGGITGCPPWQDEMISLLADLPLIVLNPRRPHFPSDDPSAAEAQIHWEHRALHKAAALLFWFPSETLCPIALYELGAWSMTSKPLFVGTHASYQRREDVIIQTRLARPDVTVGDSLEKLAQQVRAWVGRQGGEDDVSAQAGDVWERLE